MDGTGSVMIDPRTNDTLLITNNIQLWRGIPGAPAGVSWTNGFAEPLQIARPCNPTDNTYCGDAPTIFWDERIGKYCILTMFGHRIDHNKYNGTRGFGLAYQSCSANVSGGYEMAAVPWLELDGLVQLRGAPGPGLTNQVRDNTVLFVASNLIKTISLLESTLLGCRLKSSYLSTSSRSRAQVVLRRATGF